MIAIEPCSTNIPRVRHGDLRELPPSELGALARVSRALSDPIRLQMIHLLERHPDLCTCEFEQILRLGQSRVSYHLNVLLQAGLVQRETYGTWSHYSLRQQGVLERLKQVARGTTDAGRTTAGAR